jgi:hypothetical protein
LRTDGRIRAVFVVTAFLQLVPVWSVRYLPTTDGPSHLYNAWVMREVLSGRPGLVTDSFTIDWRPHPNWIGTAFMAAAMAAVPPLVAEKIFVSIIVLLFALGLWLYAASPPAALLGLLFTFHWLLQMGFYNHSLAVALFLITIALWWRRRERAEARTIAAVGALLLLCYFANPMMLLLTMGSIGLLWLVTSRDLRHLIAFLPVLPLIAWYLRGSWGTPIPEGRPPVRKLLAYLARARICYTFDEKQTFAGMAVLLIILLCIVPAVRARNVFFLLTAAVAILFFTAPEEFGHGLFLRQRLGLLLFLTPLAWIRLPRRPAIVVSIAVAMIVNAAYLTVRFRQSAAMVDSAVRTFDAAQPQHTMLVVTRGKKPPGGNFPLMWHAADYAALEHQLVDVNDYEPYTNHFPIAFRRGLGQAGLIEAEKVPVDTWAARVDYLFTSGIPPEDPFARDIRRYYRPLRIAGDGTLFVRER